MSDLYEQHHDQATVDGLLEEIEAKDKLIAELSGAYDDYQQALRNREHGWIAAHKCVDKIGLILSKAKEQE